MSESEAREIAFAAAKEVVGDHVENCGRHIAKQVDEIHKVLLGNGEPEKGLATQFASLKSNIRLLWLVFIVAIPTFAGLAYTVARLTGKG